MPRRHAERAPEPRASPAGAAPRGRPGVGAVREPPLPGLVRDVLVAGAAFACPLVWGHPVVLGTTANRGHAIVMTLVVLAWLAHVVGARDSVPMPRPWVAGPGAAVVLAAALSTIASVNKNASILFTLQLATGALLFCLVAVPANSRARKWAAGGMVAGGCIVAVIAIREYVQERAAGGEVWRAFGLFFNPNLLAGYLAIATPLALMVAAVHKRIARIGFAYAGALMALALVLTGSRGGWLAFLVGALVLFAAAGLALGRGRLGLVGAVAVVVAAGSLAIALPPLRARLATAFSGQEHAFRVLTWKGTLRMAAAYPALGSGPGTFEYVFPKYAIAGFTRMAHQNYLQVLAENGPAGLAAFLWLLAAAVVMSARALRRGELTDRLTAAACLAGLAAFIAHGFIDYTWFVGGIATSVWLLAGIGAGLSAAPGEGMILTVRRKIRIVVAVAALVVAAALMLLPVAAAVAEQDGLSGLQALRGGDRLQAEADLRAAVAWAPLDGDYWSLLGAAVGGNEGAIYMRKAIRLQPTSSMARAWLARLLLYEGRLAAASREFQAAIRQNPNYTSAWLDLAEIAMRERRISDAQRAYSAVVRIENGPYGRVRALEQRVDTDFAAAHYGLGLLSLGTDKARADKEFERAINIILEYESTQEPLDRALESLGQADPARTQRIRGLKAKVLWRSAALAKEAGDLAKYERRRGKALEADPDVQAAVEEEDAMLTRAGKPS